MTVEMEAPTEEGGEGGAGTGLPLYEFRLGSKEWTTVSLERGQVVEVYMPESSREESPDGWAAFLVMGSRLSAEGDIVLEVKSLGSLFSELDKEHSLAFNRRSGTLHLCGTKPCVCSEEHTLHATRIRVFDLQGYTAVWYTPATKRQVERWLTPSVVPGKGEDSKEKDAKDGLSGRKKVKDQSKKVPTNPKEEKKKRREEKGGVGISAAVVSGLRGKLQGLRDRVRGQKAVVKPPPWEDRKLESIDVPSSKKEESLPALEDGLQSGMDLTQKVVKNPADKATKVRKRKRRSNHQEAAVGTSGITTKNLQGQLASSAVAALQEGRIVQKRKKKMSSAEKVGNALAKALAPLGLKKVKKEKKERKRKKKKKKKKKGGGPSSSGETSSYEESSSEFSEEEDEEDSKSSEEFEAPMVKRR